LPEAGDARLGLQDPSQVPGLVFFRFIGNGGTPADQADFPFEDIEKLGELVNAQLR
jgi:hypothetical protein